MIKIVFSEIESPTTADDAIDLGRTSAVRSVNTSKTPVTVNLFDPTSKNIKSITLSGGESLILKKTLEERVFCSSKTVRISGVSIY